MDDKIMNQNEARKEMGLRALSEEEQKQLTELKSRIPLMTKKELVESIDIFNDLSRQYLGLFIRLEDITKDAVKRLKKINKLLQLQIDKMEDDEESDSETNDDKTDEGSDSDGTTLSD